MSLFNSWFGKTPPAPQSTDRSADAQAIERYRYMLKTAPPETIEQAHAEAFAQLTPEQRKLVLESLSQDAATSERTSSGRNATDPRTLAQLATRAEIRRPGTLEQTLGRAGSPGLGGLMAGSLLSTIAGTVIGSMIAHQFFSNDEASRSETVSDASTQDAVDNNSSADDYAMGESSGDMDGGSFDV